MNRKGQHVTEYALIIGVAALALAAMQPFMKRGLQGVIKLTDDEIGKCATSEFYNYTGKTVPAQVLGQGQLNLYCYTTTQNLTSIGQEEGNSSTNSIKDHNEFNDTSEFSGAWTMKYRLYTDDISEKPGDSLTSDPKQAKHE